MSYWDSDPQFPRSEWEREVADGYTLLGYHAWVEEQRAIPDLLDDVI